MKRILLIITGLMMSAAGAADVDHRVAMASSGLSGTTSLGSAHVDGAGEVSLVASRNGNQVVVHARGPNGEVIGRAETVVGLRQTPIYVMTSSGLEKITIYWNSQ